MYIIDELQSVLHYKIEKVDKFDKHIVVELNKEENLNLTFFERIGQLEKECGTPIEVIYLRNTICVIIKG